MVMSFSADITNAFQQRLAELAWAEADALCKRTLVGSLVTQLISDKSLLTKMADKIHKTVEKSVVDQLHKDKNILQAAAEATDALMKQVRKTDFTAHATEIMRKVIENHAKLEVTASTVSQMTRNMDLNAIIQQAIQRWTHDSTTTYMNNLKSELTMNTKKTLMDLLQSATAELSAIAPKT